MSNWVINVHGTIDSESMLNNAYIIRDTLTAQGWTIEAISAILGNMQAESGINPGRWENDNVGNLSGGFGLVQWTPATKVIDWIEAEHPIVGDYTNGDYQMERIAYEVSNGIQYGGVGGEFKELTFSQFISSTKAPGYLAAEFMLCYERPLKQGWAQQMARARLGEQWYQTLTGIAPKKWIPTAFIIILKRRRR